MHALQLVGGAVAIGNDCCPLARIPHARAGDTSVLLRGLMMPRYCGGICVDVRYDSMRGDLWQRRADTEVAARVDTDAVT